MGHNECIYWAFKCCTGFLSSSSAWYSRSLIATAIGLFAAIPAVIAYNRFAAKVDRLSIRYESFMEEFINTIDRKDKLAMRKKTLMNQINVVPYIDVMLVLLVIFMVTAPMTNPGVVELPKLDNP